MEKRQPLCRKAAEQEIRYEAVDDESFVKSLVDAGVPADLADYLAVLFSFSRQGPRRHFTSRRGFHRAAAARARAVCSGPCLGMAEGQAVFNNKHFRGGIAEKSSLHPGTRRML
jgi:hypothetical protein